MGESICRGAGTERCEGRHEWDFFVGKFSLCRFDPPLLVLIALRLLQSQAIGSAMYISAVVVRECNRRRYCMDLDEHLRRRLTTLGATNSLTIFLYGVQSLLDTALSCSKVLDGESSWKSRGETRSERFARDSSNSRSDPASANLDTVSLLFA